MRSPTAKSLEYLRRHGYVVAVVEYWNAFAGPQKFDQATKKMKSIGQRKDLFHIYDILALKGPQTLAVQSTSKTNMRARWHKITGGKIAPGTEDRAREIRTNVLACFDAGWDTVIFGHVKGTMEPKIMIVKRGDLVEIPEPVMEAAF